VLTVIACPQCRVPAEITECFSLPSTDGPVAHVAVGCASGHHFRMSAGRLPAPPPRQPAGRASSLVTAWPAVGGGR
jgi:hypothetical protein